MILLVDHNYILSKSCVYEAKLAAQLNKQTIPILLEKMIWPTKELGENYAVANKFRIDLYGTMNIAFGALDTDSQVYERYLCAFQNNEQMKKVFAKLKLLSDDKKKIYLFRNCFKNNVSSYQSNILIIKKKLYRKINY